MRRLFELLHSLRYALYFVLLESISLLLLGSFNDLHNNAFSEAAVSIGTRFQSVNQGIASYWNLQEENENWVQETIRLQQQIKQLEAELYRYRNPLIVELPRVALPDSLLPKQDYLYIPCKAINNSVTGTFNYITLNIGAEQGVQPEMGVVSPTGVAGVVVSVSPHYSMAMSILNRKFKLSAKIKGQNIFGTLEWDAESADYARLTFIPLHFLVKPGDTVLTSGYSTIFPEGYLIGVIEEAGSDDMGSFYDLRVRLSTDFYRLDNLYLVQHKHKAEIEALKAQTVDPNQQ